MAPSAPLAGSPAPSIALLDQRGETVDVADYRTAGVAAYSDLDGATGKPPRWFPISPGEQTIGYSSTDGTDGCTFTWRPGFD